MNEIIAARLDLIAAKAKILAADYRAGRQWPTDLSRGLSELGVELENIRRESGSAARDDYGPYGSGVGIEDR